VSGCELCVPADVIAENPLAYARYDSNPLCPGHVIVVPKRHVADFFEMTAAEQAALAPRQRGPKPAADRDQALQIARLTRDNDRLKNRLDKALFVIEVQKKVAALLGHPIDDSGETT